MKSFAFGEQGLGIRGLRVLGEGSEGLGSRVGDFFKTRLASGTPGVHRHDPEMEWRILITVALILQACMMSLQSVPSIPYGEIRGKVHPEIKV